MIHLKLPGMEGVLPLPLKQVLSKTGFSWWDRNYFSEEPISREPIAIWNL